VKISKSPPIKVLVHDHIQIQGLYDWLYLLKGKDCTRASSGWREVVQGVVVFLVVRRVVYIWQRGFVKCYTRCWFWVYKIKD